MIPNKCRLSFYFLTDVSLANGFSILILGIIASAFGYAFGFGFVIYWIRPPAGPKAGLER